MDFSNKQVKSIKKKYTLMMPLAHIVFSFFLTLFILPREKVNVINVIIPVALSAMIDLDHLFLPHAFHNIFVFFFIPMVFHLFMYVYEPIYRPYKMDLQYLSILLLSNNLLHFLLDTIDGSPIKIYYPFSSVDYTISPELTFEIPGMGVLPPTATLTLSFVVIVMLIRVFMARKYDLMNGSTTSYSFDHMYKGRLNSKPIYI